jgi:hypothetical protein
MHSYRTGIILAQYFKQVFVPALPNERAVHMQVNQVNASLFILGLALRTYIVQVGLSVCFLIISVLIMKLLG